MDGLLALAIALVKLAFRLIVVVIVGIVQLLRWGFRARGALAKELHCPMGCPPQPADGFWKCSCGASNMGWVWDECPACGALCRFVPCRHCGHAILNPLVD